MAWGLKFALYNEWKDNIDCFKGCCVHASICAEEKVHGAWVVAVAPCFLSSIKLSKLLSWESLQHKLHWDSRWVSWVEVLVNTLLILPTETVWKHGNKTTVSLQLYSKDRCWEPWINFQYWRYSERSLNSYIIVRKLKCLCVILLLYFLWKMHLCICFFFETDLSMNKHFTLLMKGHFTNVCLHLLILCVLFNIRMVHWDLTSSNGSFQKCISCRMFSMRFHRWTLWFQICLNWISFF